MRRPGLLSMLDHDQSDAAIEEAIRDAEAHTSAEIRVFITRHKPDADEAIVLAARHFERLRMTRTPMRNGVLLFVAPASGQLAVAADEAVQFHLGACFKESIHRAAAPHLPQDITRAVIAAIQAAAQPLARRFPRATFDRDDFPNDVLRD